MLLVKIVMSAIFLFSASLQAVEPKLTCPREGLKRLSEGNKRYIQEQLEHPNNNQMRREALASKQAPFAVIVGCADSRVPPEILFDQGVGDLFVVRVAGNVIGPVEQDSINYAALVLNSCLIVVVGHENCGAVNAVIENNTSGIPAVAKLIEPAVIEARKEKTDNLLALATKTNARKMRDLLLQSSALSNLLKDKKIEVHAAYYNLQTGEVELLD